MRRRDLLQVAAAAAGGWAMGARAGEGPLLQLTGRPQNLATPLHHLDQLITPTRAFFVRSHFGPPAYKPGRRFTVSGTRSISFGVGDLAQFQKHTLTTVLQCFGNARGSQVPHAPGLQWTQGAIGQATWTGVRLADILEKAGVPADAKWVRLQGADDPPLATVPAFIRGLPLEKALHPDTLVAFEMNGEPLTLSHGAPARIVAPAWVGGHWVKWLTSVKPQAEEPEGFFFQTAYRVLKAPVAVGTAVKPEEMVPTTTYPVKSVIARPADGAVLQSGTVVVTGLAVSGLAPIASVEVSADGGATFVRAQLDGEPGIGRAQVFRAELAVTAGRRALVARATDAAGNVQPRTPPWNPSGYLWNGWHQLEVEVRG